MHHYNAAVHNATLSWQRSVTVTLNCCNTYLYYRPGTVRFLPVQTFERFFPCTLFETDEAVMQTTNKWIGNQDQNFLKTVWCKRTWMAFGKMHHPSRKLCWQAVKRFRCGSRAKVKASEFTFAICCRPSVCRLSVVCLPVVCNVRAPYSGGSNFRHYFYGVRYPPWPPIDIHWKFHGDRPRGTPPPGELNIRWVVKYSDFGPIDGCISETVQDRR